MLAAVVFLLVQRPATPASNAATIHHAVVRDVSPPLATMAMSENANRLQRMSTRRNAMRMKRTKPTGRCRKTLSLRRGPLERALAAAESITIPQGSVAIEQIEKGSKECAAHIASFDLG